MTSEFQKKCLGKMNEASRRGGRTVLFVSHNTAAVLSLCDKSVLMEKGQITAIGSPSDVVARYLETNTGGPLVSGKLAGLSRRGEGNVRFRRIQFLNGEGLPVARATTGEELVILTEFDGSIVERRPCRLGITFYDVWDAPLFMCANEISVRGALHIGAGDRVICRIPRLPLSEGRYKISLFLERNGIIEDWLQDYIPIDVADGSFFGTVRNLPLGWEGKTVLVNHDWRRLDNSTAMFEAARGMHAKALSK